MRAISVDLRHRACEAVTVEVEGLSCCAAARRLEVGVSSVIRWCAQLRQAGSITQQKERGDRRSGRTAAEAVFILNRIRAKRDITLVELQAELAGRGVRVSLGALWVFPAARHQAQKTAHNAGTGVGCAKASTRGG